MKQTDFIKVAGIVGEQDGTGVKHKLLILILEPVQHRFQLSQRRDPEFVTSVQERRQN